MENIIDMYKENPLLIYNNKFFSKRRRMSGWEFNIGRYLVEKLDLSSIVDFGCGLGAFLDGALSTGGVKVLGYEYAYDNAKKYLPASIAPFVQYGNVMELIDCGKFDCAMSIEVAEHILPDKSDIFVDNLVRASNKYIIVTAAIPGQGGTGHTNEQHRDFWINKVENKGFRYNQKITSEIAQEIKGEKIRMPRRFGYLCKNIMVFII